MPTLEELLFANKSSLEDLARGPAAFQKPNTILPPKPKVVPPQKMVPPSTLQPAAPAQDPNIQGTVQLKSPDYKGMGMREYEDNKAEYEERLKGQLQEKLQIHPDTMKIMTEAAYDSPEIQEQRKAMELTNQEIQAQRDMLKNQSLFERLDLTPAFAMGDNLFRDGRVSSATSAYQRPKSLEELQMKLTEMQEKGNKQRGDLAQRINDFRKVMANGGFDDTSRQILGSIMQGRGIKGVNPNVGLGSGSREEKAWEVTWRAYEKQAKKAADAKAGAETASQLLAQGVNPADESMKTHILKASGEDRISDQDIRRFESNPTVARRLERYVNAAFGTGSLPELDRADFEKVLMILQDRNQRKLNILAAEHAKVAKNRYGLNEKSVRDDLNSRIGNVEPKQEPKKEEKKSGPMSFEEWKKAKGGK